VTRTRAALAVALTFALGGASAAAPGEPKPAAEASCPSVGEASAADLGSLDPFRPPAAKAVELNAAGKVPYRQGKWEEARTQYRAAIAADPEFLAPKLNVACSFVRQERFGEATAEVVALIERAYVPWAREVLDAADLGALKVRPEMKEIERAMTGAAARWGADLAGSLLFIARQRAPLHVPDGPGVFLLNPHQEIWAYAPASQRYRQVTSEDGHVVAMVPSTDGRRVLYVTAEKLVRGAKPDDVALRGVAIRELTYATMTVGPPARLDGDVHRLAIYYPSLIIVVDGQAPVTLEPTGALEPIEIRTRLGLPRVTLTGHGVAPAPERRFGGGLVARQTPGAGGASGIEVGRRPSGKLAPLKVGEGAGLAGLPIP
jgi:hypothetical protein